MKSWFLIAALVLSSSFAQANLNTQYNCFKGFSGSAESRCLQHAEELTRALYNIGVADAMVDQLKDSAETKLLQSWKDIRSYGNGGTACNHTAMTDLLKQDLAHDYVFSQAFHAIAQAGQSIGVGQASAQDLTKLNENKAIIKRYCSRL